MSCVTFHVRDGESMLVLYSTFRGKGQTLILIYHSHVFMPGTWHDGCERSVFGLALPISIADVFSKLTGGFVKPKEKLVPHEFMSIWTE